MYSTDLSCHCQVMSPLSVALRRKISSVFTQCRLEAQCIQPSIMRPLTAWAAARYFDVSFISMPIWYVGGAVSIYQWGNLAYRVDRPLCLKILEINNKLSIILANRVNGHRSAIVSWKPLVVATWSWWRCAVSNTRHHMLWLQPPMPSINMQCRNRIGALRHASRYVMAKFTTLWLRAARYLH